MRVMALQLAFVAIVADMAIAGSEPPVAPSREELCSRARQLSRLPPCLDREHCEAAKEWEALFGPPGVSWVAPRRKLRRRVIGTFSCPVADLASPGSGWLPDDHSLHWTPPFASHSRREIWSSVRSRELGSDPSH